MSPPARGTHRRVRTCARWGCAPPPLARAPASLHVAERRRRRYPAVRPPASRPLARGVRTTDLAALLVGHLATPLQWAVPVSPATGTATAKAAAGSAARHFPRNELIAGEIARHSGDRRLGFRGGEVEVPTCLRSAARNKYCPGAALNGHCKNVYGFGPFEGSTRARVSGRSR
jgi:hypothetical protein